MWSKYLFSANSAFSSAFSALKKLLNAENAEVDAEFAEKKPVIYSLIFKLTHYPFFASVINTNS